MDPTVPNSELYSILDGAYKAVQLLVIVGTAGLVVGRMGRMAGRFEAIGEQQAQEIAKLARKLESMEAVVTLVAVQKTEIATVQRDIALLREWYDELRHYRGFVAHSGKRADSE